MDLLSALSLSSPVIISLSLIFLTRKTSLSLCIGALVGATILHVGQYRALPSYLWTLLVNTCSNSWHWSALLFTVLLGGFAALMQSGGGLEKLFLGVKTKKGLESRVLLLGTACFFDGLANSLLLGRLVRPVADRTGVSREKLAYLADTTSSAIACLAPLSTWTAMQIGLISSVLKERDIQASPYLLFLKSIPLNFYCLSSLLLAILLVAMKKDFGPMKATVARQSTENASRMTDRSNTPAPPSAFPAITALALLVISIPVLSYAFEITEKAPVTFTKISQALGGNSGPYVFTTASMLSLFYLFLTTRTLSLSSRLHSITDGMKQMLSPLLVLLSAWLLGGVLKDLELATAITSFFELLHITPTPSTLPCIVFLLGCTLSFTTGTSWGTMALLFPLTFGMVETLPDESLLTLLPILISAILSGAVFGDHCSPYSDTTIVSSVATGCSTFDHVRTQLPYALLAGGISGILFYAVGISL